MSSIDEFNNIPASIIEMACNKWLSLDPEIYSRLKPLINKCIAVKIKGFDKTFFIVPHQKGIYIKTTSEYSPDVTIIGPPIALLKLTKIKPGETVISSDEIEIEGNTEIAARLGEIFSSMEIDWEEHLSQILGDILARRLSVTENNISQWVSSSIESVREDIRDYLREEKKLTVYPEDIENFSQDVNIIRNNTERLEQRITRLESKMPHKNLNGAPK